MASMCEIALIGVRGEIAELRKVLSARCHDDADGGLDLDSTPEPRALACFPEDDSVLVVTRGGCSCQLLRGLGLADAAARDAHLAGPGYAFRRAIASATLRFGSARLLIFRPNQPQFALRSRATSLSHLLRAGICPSDHLLLISS